MSKPAVLIMGFSPAAAVATWRLAQSQAVTAYTYWPVPSLTFNSEVFGLDQSYLPQQFDLQNSAEVKKLPSSAFAAVILVVPTIKDVVRMCRRIQPVINKNTLVLVDVSGGIAPLQRLVRSHLDSSLQVVGLMCDIEAEVTAKSAQNWVISHRRSSTNGKAKSISITIEPCANLTKSVTALESAWSTGGLPATHSKNATVFGELQWQNTIAVVAFELLSVALDIPDNTQLAESLIAKPIIDGLVSEMSMIAQASGIKGLSSRSKLVARASELTRRAPPTFIVPGATKTYYDVYNRAPIALDFLVLLPILLSDELPKGGATPYLESLYAYMSRKLALSQGDHESALFVRADQNSKADSASKVDPALLNQLNTRSEAIAKREEALGAREKQLEVLQTQLTSRESEVHARELRSTEVMESIRRQQEQQQARSAELENQTAQNQRRLQSFEELNERAERMRIREEQAAEAERKFNARDRALRQREADLASRENEAGGNPAISNANLGMAAMNGGAVNGGAANGQSGLTIHTNGPSAKTPVGPGSPVMPVSPGGTAYSRFDPRAPRPPPQPQVQSQPQIPMNTSQFPMQSAPLQSMPPQSPLQPSQGSMMAGPYGHPPLHRSRSSQPVQNMPVMSSSASIHSVYAPDQAARRQFAGAPNGMHNGMSHSVPSGMNGNAISNGHAMPYAQGRRRPSRIDDDIGSAPHRRRNQSMPINNSSFSQNFQLDGIMGTATDRYHFVSTRKNLRDVKLSSDEDAYTANRKFVHGGPNSGSISGMPMSPRQNSVHNLSVDLGSGAYPDSTSRTFNPGDLSIGSLNNTAGTSTSTNTQRRQVAGMSKSVSSPVPARPLLPNPLAPNSNDFAGFSFGVDSQTPSNGSSGSNNVSSSGSQDTVGRSAAGTPPTPHGTLDPAVLQKWSNNGPTVEPMGL